MNLVDLLNQTRAQLEPDDHIALCRDGRQADCQRVCPGPDQFGSACVYVTYDDDRSSEEIAQLIKGA